MSCFVMCARRCFFDNPAVPGIDVPMNHLVCNAVRGSLQGGAIFNSIFAMDVERAALYRFSTRDF